LLSLAGSDTVWHSKVRRDFEGGKIMLGKTVRYRIALGCSIPFLALPAAADPIATRFFTTVGITATPSDFSASSFLYRSQVDFDGGAGSYDWTFKPVPVATAISISGQGATLVAPTSFPDGTTSGAVSAASPGGAGQGFLFGYDGVASSVPGDSLLTFGIIGGRYALTFTGGGTETVAAGSDYFLSIIIYGDYSSPSSHTPILYSPEYTLITNFQYFAGGGRTGVELEMPRYIQEDATISFSLLGDVAPVPEPASFALLIMGFFSLGLIRLALNRKAESRASVM
jgi:hypothetical protein